MIYTKEKFKELWEANEYGPGITLNDISDCAKAWGISECPRIYPIDGGLAYRVLKAAQVSDAEEYNPNPTPQCDGRTMIDLDKACEWLETEWEDLGIKWIRGTQAAEIVEQFRKAMESGCSEFPNNREKGGEE